MARRPEEGHARGRPKTLSREAIVEAAAKLPPESFSLTKLAESLEVSSQSLYHYFPNKESIARAISHHIIDSVPIPNSSLPWRDYLSQMINGYRDWLLASEYPIARSYGFDGIKVFRVADERNEALLKRFDTFLGVMVRDGFQVSEALEVWVFVGNFLRRSDLHRAKDGGLEKPWAEFQEDLNQAQEGEFPALDGVRGASCPSVDAVYAAGVEILIEGISGRYGVK